jgi:hypothetical protein
MKITFEREVAQPARQGDRYIRLSENKKIKE